MVKIAEVVKELETSLPSDVINRWADASREASEFEQNLHGKYHGLAVARMAQWDVSLAERAKVGELDVMTLVTAEEGKTFDRLQRQSYDLEQPIIEKAKQIVERHGLPIVKPSTMVDDVRQQASGEDGNALYGAAVRTLLAARLGSRSNKTQFTQG